jgi:hypothetical protein
MIFWSPTWFCTLVCFYFLVKKSWYQNLGIGVLNEKNHCRVIIYAWTSLTKQIKASRMIWWKHNQVYTKSSPKSYSHIFTRKCKKVESKPFQSLSNHHGAKYWVYSVLYIKFENFSVLKVCQKYFWNSLVKLCSKLFLH